MQPTGVLGRFQLGQGDVEQHHVGRLVVDERDRLGRGVGIPDDLDALRLVEDLADADAHDRAWLDHDEADRPGRRARDRPGGSRHWGNLLGARVGRSELCVLSPA